MESDTTGVTSIQVERSIRWQGFSMCPTGKQTRKSPAEDLCGDAKDVEPVLLSVSIPDCDEAGSPLAVLDGRLITEMRTAAGSAAAARKPAVAIPDVVTIMGSVAMQNTVVVAE